MKVIITGGTGLIGRSFAQALLPEHEVIILTRNTAKHNAPSGTKVVQWDAQSADNWGHLIDNQTAIVNLAGAGISDGRWTKTRKEEITQSRVKAGQAVMQAIEKASQKPAVLLQASAIGYYGTQYHDHYLDETTPAGNDFLANVVQEWEASTAGASSKGVRRVVLRTGVVFSPDGGALPQIVSPFRLGLGGPLGSGEQWVSWIHIADQIRAMQFLLTQPEARGIYNLTAPNPVTNRFLANKVGVVLNALTFVPAPAFALKLALGEMATIVLDGQRVFPNRLLEEGFNFRYTDVETALRALLA